jgi:hypothetical protein
MALTASHPQFVPSSPAWQPAPVRRKLTAVAAAFAMVGVAGYGVSQLSGDSQASSPAASSPVNLPLSARVLAPSVLPSFAVTRNPAPIRNASAWATVEKSPSLLADGARLRALGFVGGVAEQLHAQATSSAQAASDAQATSSAQATSIVEQFRSSAGARRELAYQYAQLHRQAGAKGEKGEKVSTFSVPAIPGARGVRVSGGASAGLNILFSAGAYYYAVSAGSPGDAHGTPSQGQLSAAAGWLYLASKGCVSSPTQGA